MNTSSALQKDYASKPMRSGHNVVPCCSNNTQGMCFLHALLPVTSRRKATTKKKTLLECTDLDHMQKKYEDLLLQFETQKATSDLKIAYLTRRLEEAGLDVDNTADKTLNESEAILVVKQLQKKINMLEMEKSSSQQNLDDVVELLTIQQINADIKFEEIYEELQNAREEAEVARESVISVESFSRGGRDRDTLESESGILPVCSCTRNSTCKTRKCKCRDAGRDCIRSCTCQFMKCSNRKQ